MKHMRAVIAILSIALLETLTGAALAELINLEEAIETKYVRFVMRGANSGYMIVRRCAQCEPLKISINENTRGFAVDQPAALSESREHRSGNLC